MVRDRGSMIAIGAGIGVMIVAVLVGNSIQTDVGRLGVDAYMAQGGAVNAALFFLFAFGFPAGLGLAAVGAATANGTTLRRMIVLLLLAAGAAAAPVLVPLAFGRAASPVFFSTGGYLILALAGVTMWFWADRRRRTPPETQLAIDLQGAGYTCFGMAAWNICGVGGMPSFALRPEQAVELGTQAFATGQMKAVMALLVLGWILTVLGYWKSR